MKKILILFTISLFVMACKPEPKDYVTLSGKIINVNQVKKITIQNRDGYRKELSVNDDGTFNDTLKVEAGDYSFKHGDEYGTIFLKNNNTTSFTLDYEDFDNSLIFEGDGADNNNFNIKMHLLPNDYLPMDVFNEGIKENLDKGVNDYKKAYENLKLQYTNVDSLHLANADATIPGIIASVENYFKYKAELRKEFALGLPSPVFENYENHKDGTTSLTDLKGKYVYIDIWATWCGPCKREIPSLKELENKYQGKNIEFVSISVDDARRSGSDEKAYESWKNMVIDKNLTGIQLFADKAWQSDFIKAYKIKSIPRFLLIDPNSNIISGDTYSPSNPKLLELFNKLNI